MASGMHAFSKFVGASEESFTAACDSLDRRLIPDALAEYDRAETLGFDPDACASGRWKCWMLSGRFERAWMESEAIGRRGAPDPHRFWDGQPFTGKRVMLRCLHGLGDAIQFVRYTRLLRRETRSLTVQTHPQLVSLFHGLDSVDHVITWEQAEPHWDQQIELMELPRAFGATLCSVPADVPYLRVDSGRLERSREALGHTAFPKIGVLWESSNWDPARCVPLSEFGALFQLPGFSFYGLQQGPLPVQLQNVVHDTFDHSGDVVDTAANICNLDLVITVDTMVAHLAGALGAPVWTLLPFRADWRWMLDRPDSPWYPTMRLFRQPSSGDWGSVIKMVARALERAAPANFTPPVRGRR
jgi:hypothetical protein